MLFQRNSPKNLLNFYRQIVYVPKHKPPNPEDVTKLLDFLTKHKRCLVLTGAGISTESGK